MHNLVSSKQAERLAVAKQMRKLEIDLVKAQQDYEKSKQVFEKSDKESNALKDIFIKVIFIMIKSSL